MEETEYKRKHAFNVDIKLTGTSFAGYMILLIGCVAACWFEDKGLVSEGMLYAAGLLGVRQVGNAMKRN